jgi:hypothetical protein
MTLLAERLTGEAAVDRAMLLRGHGMSYMAIAQAMTIYHGECYSDDRWRWKCRGRGAWANPAYRRVAA